MGFPSRKDCQTKYATGPAPAPNPDSKRWELLDKAEIGGYSVVKVRYLDCTNFEGVKIMVLRGTFLLSRDELDPHFSESEDSPIARFRPDENGWKLACDFAKSFDVARETSLLREQLKLSNEDYYALRDFPWRMPGIINSSYECYPIDAAFNEKLMRRLDETKPETETNEEYQKRYIEQHDAILEEFQPDYIATIGEKRQTAAEAMQRHEQFYAASVEFYERFKGKVPMSATPPVKEPKP